MSPQHNIVACIYQAFSLPIIKFWSAYLTYIMMLGWAPRVGYYLRDMRIRSPSFRVATWPAN